MDGKAVEYARKNFDFGGNVQLISLFDAKFPRDSFDLVVMRGVIEHMPNPHRAIDRVGKLLKKGGYFYIAATPNIESFCADIYREKWNQFHPIRHLYYFSPHTLLILCEKNDMSLVAQDFPYTETPYARIREDHIVVLHDFKLLQNDNFEKIERSPPFWGNMMNIVFQKQ